MNICSRLPLVGAICGVVCSFALSANAVAQQQEIYPNPLVAEVVAAGAVSLDVMYDVSDADATLTGIGVRVHFDSSKLTFDLVDTTLAFGRLFDPTLVVSEADTSDHDADATTDRFISLAWVDFGGSWPGSLPEKLAAVHFVAAGDFAGSTTVRFSASDLAAGYGFSPTPATVNEATTTWDLSVTTSGTGTGTVSSSPAGIDCGADCSETYNDGTLVDLSASAAAGSEFVSWSGACSGSASPVSVTMDADKSCDALFNIVATPTWDLSVTRSGTGTGTVSSSPAGIDCGADCSETYNDGTLVMLTATATSGDTFVSWSGACSGSVSPLGVTMDADKSCDAEFSAKTNTYTIGGTVSGLATDNEVVLQNNSGDNLTVNANGLFTFATALDDGSTYTVTVLTQPTNPGQTCNVTGGSGTVAGADVTDVSVICVTDTFSVGGNVEGLAGSGLILQNNAGDDLAISADGSFTFATALDDGSTYAVTVLTQPTNPGQTCSVTGGSGTVAGADVTDVSVICVTRPENIFTDSFE